MIALFIGCFKPDCILIGQSDCLVTTVANNFLYLYPQTRHGQSLDCNRINHLRFHFFVFLLYLSLFWFFFYYWFCFSSFFFLPSFFLPFSCCLHFHLVLYYFPSFLIRCFSIFSFFQWLNNSKMKITNWDVLSPTSNWRLPHWRILSFLIFLVITFPVKERCWSRHGFTQQTFPSPKDVRSIR